jgi:DNA-directed RNA polymerase specialized sigma subunit
VGDKSKQWVNRINQKAQQQAERYLENHLRLYNTYLVGIKNCEKQLNYIMPSLVSKWAYDEGTGAMFYIVNDTEKVAIDRIEGKRAIDLKEEIERYKLITESIDNALEDLTEIEKRFVLLRYYECRTIAAVTSALGYAEDKSVYKIRRHVLDKLLISLHNLLSL